MKSFFLTAFCLFFTAVNFAQVTENQEFVEVVGQAEMTVDPDEFFYKISPKTTDEDTDEQPNLHSSNPDYDPNQAEKQKEKQRLRSETNKKKIADILKEAGISEESIVFGSRYEIEDNANKIYNPYGVNAEKDAVTLFLTDVKKLDNLVIKLRNSNMFKGEIISVNHSKSKTFMETLRLDALKNAKEKAGKMLVIFGQTAGKVMQIREPETSDWQGISSSFRQLMSLGNIFRGGGKTNAYFNLDGLNPKEMSEHKIVLRREVIVRFRIQ